MKIKGLSLIEWLVVVLILAPLALRAILTANHNSPHGDLPDAIDDGNWIHE